MLDPLGHIIRLTYDQPGETYSSNPTGVAVDIMNGPTLLIESGAAIDVLKHTGCLGTPHTAKSAGRGGAIVFFKKGEKWHFRKWSPIRNWSQVDPANNLGGGGAGNTETKPRGNLGCTAVNHSEAPETLGTLQG